MQLDALIHSVYRPEQQCNNLHCVQACERVDVNKDPCHCCLQRKAIGLTCSKNEKCCTQNRYCSKCLYHRFGARAYTDNSHAWTCPSCRGICTCSKCRRASGQEPLQNIRGVSVRCALLLPFRFLPRAIIFATRVLTRSSHCGVDETLPWCWLIVLWMLLSLL